MGYPLSEEKYSMSAPIIQEVFATADRNNICKKLPIFKSMKIMVLRGRAVNSGRAIPIWVIGEIMNGMKTEKCAYFECCYLAEALECFGYKSDCILYMKSNNRFYTRKSFDDAIDRLIDTTRVRHGLLKP